MMRKRLLAVLTGALMVASALIAAPALAQEAPAIPANPNITDPSGDSNGHSAVTGEGGGLYVGAADFLSVWFTHDPQNLYVHIHTTSKSFSLGSIWYSIYVDPGVGSDCMEFRGYTAHQAVTASANFFLRGDCGTASEKVEFLTQDGPEIDGAASGIHTITVPRALTEHLADGKTLSIPNALDRYYAGTDTTGGVGLGILDATDEGTPYVITSEESVPEESADEEEPPGKSDPPGKGKKKGCKKGKGQKKGACPGKKPGKPETPAEACPAYVPGEEGAEAGETLVVTDQATAEEPLEVAVDAPEGHGNDLGLGVYDGTASVFRNLQVDTSGAETGLYVTYEFPLGEDHDIYLNYASGNEAAHAGGFNPAPVPVAFGCCDGTGSGGHSTQTSENLDGIKSGDCQGYTLRLSSYLSEGGEMTLKLWVGEVQNDPAPDEDGGAVAAASSLSLFDLLMSF